MTIESLFSIVDSVPQYWWLIVFVTADIVVVTAVVMHRRSRKADSPTDQLRRGIKFLRREGIVVKDNPELVKVRKSLPVKVKKGNTGQAKAELARRLDIGTGEVELAMSIHRLVSLKSGQTSC